MASLNAIQRYLIIIRKIRDSGGVTLKELQEKIENELTAHGDTQIASSPRTLKRDIRNIRNDLGIGINYSHSKGYHIAEDEVSSPENIETILESFDILNALNADTGLNHVVFPERRPYRGTEHLYPLLKAIRGNRLVHIHHQKYGETVPKERDIYPYALKECHGRWYLLGIPKEEETIKTFGLDRIIRLQVLPEKFMPRKIDIHAQFQDSFGILVKEELPTEEVIISFDENDGKYVESLPIHHSQVRIPDFTNKGRMMFRLTLKITEDLLLELFSRGYSMRVHQPEHLRQKVCDRHWDALVVNVLDQF
ncbi:helix-turn-helix transcriptional regulator [Odoribacter lunatus]|uniref:helix-turn-helix transcriptional regulator n=1 Tax=Odoribacter lunatus TaxID=2941335 RepID=UPI00203EBF1B|nr:WYL domain-containing protein [Odoribacter lunatus]